MQPWKSALDGEPGCRKCAFVLSDTDHRLHVRRCNGFDGFEQALIPNNAEEVALGVDNRQRVDPVAFQFLDHLAALGRRRNAALKALQQLDHSPIGRRDGHRLHVDLADQPIGFINDINGPCSPRAGAPQDLECFGHGHVRPDRIVGALEETAG